MRAKRIDGNQNEIVKELRKLGCSVAVTSQLGNGFPDLIIGVAGENHLVELKDGDKPPSQRNLTKLEHQFKDTWRGKVYICCSLEEIIQKIGIYKK
jgi:hypothetical protein